MSDARPTTFTYDWHAEPEGFWKWLIPSILGHVVADGAVYDELTERSDQWRRTEVRILVNDYEVDARGFLTLMRSTLDDEVRREAERVVGEIRELRALKEFVEDLEEKLSEQVFQLAHRHGIELGDD
jgi:hypothetical protein